MEKQPDKLEVLMDWFLGDAKEITATQKEMTQKLSELSEKLAKDTESLGETADSFKRALVENQRSISLAISDDAKAREEFLTKFRRAQASSAETFTRQILFITDWLHHRGRRSRRRDSDTFTEIKQTGRVPVFLSSGARRPKAGGISGRRPRKRGETGTGSKRSTAERPRRGNARFNSS